jgi:hypothetical protein
VIQISGNLEVVEKLTVSLGNPSKKDEREISFHPRVTLFEQEKAFHWLGTTLVRGLMDGEYIFEIEPIDNQRTRFIHG